MDPKRYVRGMNVVLGGWLAISAFCWPHSHQQFTNAWCLGLLISAVSIVSFWVPSARYANTVLAVWLFSSSWVLQRLTEWTLWNHVVVAIAVFIASLIPSAPLSYRSASRPISSAHSA